MEKSANILRVLSCYKFVTYLCKDLFKVPRLDVRLLISIEDQDLSAVRADSAEAAICIPGEALNAGQDSISLCGLCSFFHHFVLISISKD